MESDEIALQQFAQKLTEWTSDKSFSAAEVDCFTTVMLRILDGKSKMSDQGKAVMLVLYDRVKLMRGEKLGKPEHQLIALARTKLRVGRLDDAMRMQLCETRLQAETVISQQVFHAFQESLRIEGIIAAGVEL